MGENLKKVRAKYPLAFHRYLQFGYVGREPLVTSVRILEAKRELGDEGIA